MLYSSVVLGKCITSYIHHYSAIQNFHYYCTSPCTPPVLLPLPPLNATDLPTDSIALPFPDCQTVGIIQYVTFPDWPPLLGIVHLKFLRVFHGLRAHLFLSLNNIVFVWVYHSLSVHLLKATLVASMFLAIANRAARNICVQVFVWTKVFNSFG